jgi:hypothetical protein
MVTVTTQINNLEAAKALAAQIQKPAQPRALRPSDAALLEKIEAGTSIALIWKDARGRLQVIFEGEAVSPERYLKAEANTVTGKAINPHRESLSSLGRGGEVYIISQDGEERFHCNLWSQCQLDADVQHIFEPHINCLFVRSATPLEKKLWLSGEAA